MLLLVAINISNYRLLGVSYLSGIILGDVMCNESLCIGLDVSFASEEIQLKPAPAK